MNQAKFTNVNRYSTVTATPKGTELVSSLGPNQAKLQSELKSFQVCIQTSQAEKVVELLSSLSSFSTARLGRAKQGSMQEREI